jgi:hypothetical protein
VPPRARRACSAPSCRRVRKSVHAARWYSWSSPPIRSRLCTWPRRSSPTRVSVDLAAPEQCPVRTVPVVVLQRDPEDPLQVTTANGQQPVQAFGADSTDPPLGVGVGVRRLDGVTSTSAPSERSTSSNPQQNFASRSPTQRAPTGALVQHREQAARLLGNQAPLGLAVTPADAPGGWPVRCRNSWTRVHIVFSGVASHPSARWLASTLVPCGTSPRVWLTSRPTAGAPVLRLCANVESA